MCGESFSIDRLIIRTAIGKRRACSLARIITMTGQWCRPTGVAFQWPCSVAYPRNLTCATFFGADGQYP
jgi:hypothetical protein